MDIGLMWFDDSKVHLGKKIERGLDAYRKKYPDSEPDTIYINDKQLEAEPKESLDRDAFIKTVQVTLKGVHHLLPNTFWIGKAINRPATLVPLLKPGGTVEVPLGCLPEYMQLHGLASTDYDEKAQALIVERRVRTSDQGMYLEPTGSSDSNPFPAPSPKSGGDHVQAG